MIECRMKLPREPRGTQELRLRIQATDREDVLSHMEDGEDKNVQVHDKIGLATCYALVGVRLRDRLKPPDTQITMRSAIEECRDAASCFRNFKPTNIHMNAVRKFTHCSLLTASLNLVDEVKLLADIHYQHSALGPGSVKAIVDKPQVKARCFLVNGYRIYNVQKKPQEFGAGMSNRPGITAGKRRFHTTQLEP